MGFFRLEMFQMRNKQWFLDEFYKLKSDDREKINTLIDHLEVYLEKHESDRQLELVLHLLTSRRKDHISNDFVNTCETTAPIINFLQAIPDWDFFEIGILASAIGHIESYSLTVGLMQKALDIINSKFAKEERCEGTKLQFFYNITLRQLRAKYYDNVDPEELQKMFDQYINSAISICEEKNFITYRTVLLTRKAIFDENADDILECIAALKDTGDQEWLNTTSDEVVEYCRHLGKKITVNLKNFMVGHQIKKRRKELNLSTMDLAEAIGANQTVVNEFERGGRGVSGKRLFLIAKVLKVEMSYFYGEAINERSDAITDITIHKMVQLMETLSETEKEYLLSQARLYTKLFKNADDQLPDSEIV